MDINVIKKRREELAKGGNSNSDSKLWKPSNGKSVVRAVPYKYNLENPFSEAWWHYKINKKHYLCNKRNFGEDCPICKLASDLWQEGKNVLENKESSQKEKDIAKSDQNIAKKMFANMSYYLPIIVRGEEQKGTRLWRINQNIYDSLTTPYINREIDDFTDVETGIDINVEKRTPEEVGNLYGETKASFSYKGVSPLLPKEIASEELLNKILDEQEELFEMLKNAKVSAEDMEKTLQEWFDVTDNESNESNDNSNNEETSNKTSDIMNKFKDIIGTDTKEE